eukprot:scaffold632_cov78-Phaeocystis_antarctica.AAC.1
MALRCSSKALRCRSKALLVLMSSRARAAPRARRNTALPCPIYSSEPVTAGGHYAPREQYPAEPERILPRGATECAPVARRPTLPTRVDQLVWALVENLREEPKKTSSEK